MDPTREEFLLPLFPLPSLVFFPQTRVPLHIFEPRYLTMVSDALAGDSMIGMALLKPGFEPTYHANPPVYDVGTVGEIEQAVEYDDGRYDISLKGIIRYRIIEHLEHQPYRIARVAPVPEEAGDPQDSEQQREILRELSNRYLSHFSDSRVPELETASLAALVNALAMALNIEPHEKQELLENSSIMRRSEVVSELIRERLRVIDFLAPYRQQKPGRN